MSNDKSIYVAENEGTAEGVWFLESNGMRLTDCCGSYSTYFDDDLVCKICMNYVKFGEGDGTEHRSESLSQS
tara:strand:- start:1696 stop:1911 length:216 start_codon:yes stop_codon:yes gene_type:complete